MIRFAPNKNNDQKVVEEQAVWRGTNCYFKISLISLKVSAICTVLQYEHFKLYPKLTLPAYLWLNTNHLRNFQSGNQSQDKSCKETEFNEQDKEKFQWDMLKMIRI